MEWVVTRAFRLLKIPVPSSDHANFGLILRGMVDISNLSAAPSRETDQ